MQLPFSWPQNRTFGRPRESSVSAGTLAVTAVADQRLVTLGQLFAQTFQDGGTLGCFPGRLLVVKADNRAPWLALPGLDHCRARGLSSSASRSEVSSMIVLPCGSIRTHPVKANPFVNLTSEPWFLGGLPLTVSLNRIYKSQ